MEILHIENLSFSYSKAHKKALNNINLAVNAGEFIVVCGESGCGKTTLLKLIKKELAPFGEKSGTIHYEGISQTEISDKASANEIGYVLQNPDNQIVTDKVWHELSFGLENLGVKTAVIRRRVGEMASYFGIHEWFRKSTDELSGGQKQLLNLASIMVMQPKILLLDEPTSQLDPIAAADFIATIQKLNREFGLTIILAEHRLEDVFPIADKIVLMEDGKVLLFDTPRMIGQKLKKINANHAMLAALPSAVQIFNAFDFKCFCPLTVKEGRNFLQEHFTNKISQVAVEKYNHLKTVAVDLKEVWFRYEKNMPDILRGVNMQVFEGEIYCLLGGNGTGKTTLLNVISGIDRAYRGKIMISGKKIENYKGNELYQNNLAYLPQNPQTVFLKSTVEDDFAEILNMNPEKSQVGEKIKIIVNMLEIRELLKKHPYDLSGGEQQKCALAKMMIPSPKILLLDEPTKGIDAHFKKKLKIILKEFKAQGITVIIVTHDVEFAAENADRCGLFFDGEIISSDTPEAFFADNNFYTTAANRISRHMYEGAVTCEAVMEICRKNEVKSYKKIN